MRFYFTRSARRHKIGKAHALAALANGGDPTEDPEGNLHWMAEDDRGVELHLKGRRAVEDPNLVVIFHVQPTDLRRTK